MKFKKKTLNETLTNAELCKGGVEAKANGNNVGNCPTNNNASGCGAN